jgi:hypothetical protein
MKNILALICLIFLLVSCEDVIEIDLDTIEPKLVIEGCLNDMDLPCTIKLSKTGDYFSPGIYPTVSDAEITITDEHGFRTVFEETEPGTYTSNLTKALENTSYSLSVSAEGQNYHAEATVPQKVYIDSLSYDLPPMLFEFEEGFMVKCYLQDPPETRNYYRMKAYKKGDTQAAKDGKFVFNDDFMNGNMMIVDWEFEAFLPLDTVVVELQTLDKSTYDYYYTMFSLAGGMFSSPNPANPETNLSNDALGYFGAYTMSRDTIVILPF